MAGTKSAITFHMSYIPITLHRATKHNDISFNKLHREDNSRIRQKEFCSHCGKEVGSEDIVKGYEYEPEKYIIVTQAEIDMIKTEKDRSMQIDHFTTLNTIDPIYYDTTYHAVPAAGSEQQFELFRLAMMEAQIVAVAKTVLGNKETLFTLIPRENGIMAQTMFFHDEVRPMQPYSKPDIPEEQIKLASGYINQLKRDYEPERYKNEFYHKMRELLASKEAQQEIVQAAPEGKSNVIDFLDAVRIEAEKLDDAGKPKRRRKKTGA